MSFVLKVDDNNFESEVLGSEKPVLVDFNAKWCGPCVRQSPILEQFASRNDDNVKVVEVDIDDSPKTTSKYAIRSVPTLILFVDSKPFHTKVGVNSLSVLEEMLQSTLNIKQ